MPEDIFNYFDIGFISCSDDGTIHVINKTAFHLLDLKEKYGKPDELSGNNVDAIFKEYTRMIERAIAEGSCNNLELFFKRSDGSKAYLVNSLKFDEETGMVNIMVRDVSDEKQSEDSLKNSEKRLMSIIDLIPDIIYRLDNDGKILFINDRICQYGYNPEELIGTSMIDLIHPDDRKKALFKVNERRTGERRTNFFHIRLLSKSKIPVPFEIESKTICSSTAFVINAEGIYVPGSDSNLQFDGTQGIARDISTRKGLAHTVTMDEDRYYFILNLLEDGFYEIDLDGKLTFVNDSLAKIMGYEKDEMIGLPYTDFLIPEFEEKVTADFKNIINDNDLNMTVSLKALRNDGKSLLLEGSISKINNNNDDGEAEGFMGTVRDVTSKKKIEEDLFRARKLEAIGIFSGGIAHDYNNALTTIIGNIALAKLELQSGNTNILEILNDAENASIKVRDLTHKLSALSKGGKPVKKPTGINTLIRDAIDITLHDYKGRLELKIKDDLKLAEVDEFQIGHLIEYILINAVEAMDDEGLIKITAENINVEKEESHHEITLLKGEYVKISIEDNGSGIDPNDIEKIFDPYFTTKESRSGMGLAISYAVIKRHNGYIDVKSVKDKGSVFYIYLPVNL